MFNRLIWRGKPVKRLTKSYVCSSGRNNRGVICVRARGGGYKRRYRIVDYSRFIENVPAFVVRLEFDPIRRKYLSLLCYSNGYLSYILSIRDLIPGDIIKSATVFLSTGYSYHLSNLPSGIFVNCLEFEPGNSGRIGRAPGVKCQVLSRVIERNTGLVSLPSGEVRRFSLDCKATVGILLPFLGFYSNSKFKAGRSRNLGFRPMVRGVAMNPVDHPHGGGEGRTSGGRPGVSPWGVLTKGFKTRQRRKNKHPLVLKRRTEVK